MATSTEPSNAEAGLQNVLGDALTNAITGLSLSSATNLTATFSQPVFVLVTSTVYGLGALSGPPRLIAWAWLPLFAAESSFAATTVLPLYHWYMKLSPGNALVTVTVAVPS